MGPQGIILAMNTMKYLASLLVKKILKCNSLKDIENFFREITKTGIESPHFFHFKKSNQI